MDEGYRYKLNGLKKMALAEESNTEQIWRNILFEQKNWSDIQKKINGIENDLMK